MRTWLAAGSICAALAAGPAEARQARPVDQCVRLAGYPAFRAKLEDIVRRRDAKALTGLLAPDVIVDFGGEQGRAAFFRAWQLRSPATSPVWVQLQKIFKLGCFADNASEVTLPHMAGIDPHWNEDRVSPKALVLGENIHLRAGPGAQTASKARLSWEFVETSEELLGQSGWVPVKTQSGLSGYMHGDFLRDTLDYRLTLRRKGAAWSITALVAGD
jgi:hypothetical protein